MTILGVDPGIGRTGYGVLNLGDHRAMINMIDYGCISTPPNSPQPLRLHQIYKEFTVIVQQHVPDVIALESLFFKNNVTTAMAVSRASGIIALVAAEQGLDVVEYTPAQVKSAIAGYGNADKGQMQRMITKLLKLDDIPRPDDAADGLSLALCHAVSADSLKSRV
jgi:crossover junction endodeoxyribonuclease RuvC